MEDRSPETRRFVEHMAMVLNDWGFPRMPARLLVALMTADDGALSAAELAEQLEVSAAAISTSVRYLSQVGLVVRVPSPGSRRDRYRLPDDPWYEATLMKSKALEQLADVADDGVAAVGDASPAGRRLAEMRDFFRFIQIDMADQVNRWRAYKASHDPRDHEPAAPKSP